MMGYQTPNIDRIANEGLNFTDYYGEQSCTAGRAAFITGQIPVRTGLTKVGMPGAPQGIQDEDPTIAELLKPLGYMTGQFGKNHLGDRSEFFPTVHGLGFGSVGLQRDLVFRKPCKYKSLLRITSEKSRKPAGTRICDDLLMFVRDTCYKRRYVPQDHQT
jgi:arylsulfatase A-like enzyme